MVGCKDYPTYLSGFGNPRISVKECNLLKGAIRRVFSRSELRQAVLKRSMIGNHEDLNRPRVKKWSVCFSCLKFHPTYQMEVDHVNPVVPVNMSLLEMDLDWLVNKIWCPIDTLKVLCKECHREKTKGEMRERREFRKLRSK